MFNLNIVKELYKFNMFTQTAYFFQPGSESSFFLLKIFLFWLFRTKNWFLRCFGVFSWIIRFIFLFIPNFVPNFDFLVLFGSFLHFSTLKSILTKNFQVFSEKFQFFVPNSTQKVTFPTLIVKFKEILLFVNFFEANSLILNFLFLLLSEKQATNWFIVLISFLSLNYLTLKFIFKGLNDGVVFGTRCTFRVHFATQKSTIKL